MNKLIKRYKAHLLLLVGVLLLYSYSLSQVPVHLNQDELMFGLNAKAMASGLRDYYGNFLPFYFWHLNSFWATPVIVYLGALVLKLVPISEAVIRLPSVIVGVLNVALVMTLAQKVFNKKRISLIAGFLMATTPVHFIHSRLLLDNLYTVPFVLAWLIFLHNYISEKEYKSLFWGGLALGIGLHSYHAAKVIMPVFFIATLVTIYIKEKFDFKKIAIHLVGFLLPVIIFIPWLKEHPDTLLNQVSYIGSIDRSVDVGRGIFGVFSKERVGSIASSYISYFSPKILFTVGDRSLIHSTGLVGAFLFPISFLLAFGLLRVFRKPNLFLLILVFGLLVYPIAPSLVNDPQRISRGLVVIPFMVLLATAGVDYLLALRKKDFQLLIKAIFVLLIIEFLFFLGDYFGNYRERSHRWFNEDIGGAYEALVNSNNLRDVDTIYLDGNISFITYYSDFYQLQYGVDLSKKLKYFDYTREEFSEFPSKTLVLVRSDHIMGRDNFIGEFEKVEIIREPDGTESFYLFYRD